MRIPWMGRPGWIVVGALLAGCGAGGGAQGRADAAEPEDGPAPRPESRPEAPPDAGLETLLATADAAAGADRFLPAVCELCGAYATVRTIGTVQDPMLNELSGLAASRINPGVLYGHNDDDDKWAQFFAMDLGGNPLGRFLAAGGAPKADTEDIAVGPCPTGSCVYLADAGDGGRVQTTPNRIEYALFRLPEPTLPAAEAITHLPFERFRFAYPDGSHDSEALVVDPTSGTVYLLTKVRAGATSAYRLPNPLREDVLNMASKVAELPIARMAPADDIQVTAASAHPCGGAILVTTYTHVYELRRPAGAEFAALFTASPTRWTASVAAEAITYRADGRGYITAREGAGRSLNEALCR